MIIYKTLHADQKMLPDVHSNNPYINSLGKENIVYLSKLVKCLEDMLFTFLYLRHAPPMDGPLTAGAYILPITLDRGRESVGASRQQGYLARSLPLDKYIVYASTTFYYFRLCMLHEFRWKFGPRFIPFCNVVKILDEVASSGGDWEMAFKKHIAS